VKTVLPAAGRVESWLRQLPGFEAARVGGMALAEGGVSNITCRVALEGAPLAAVALRLQRERGIFEPYDVIREGRVLQALAKSTIPVPRVLAMEPDRSVLGAPFIACEWIEAPHMGIAGAEADFGAFTRMVVEIHRAPWQELGLGFLGVPASTAEATAGEVEAVARRMPGFGCEAEPLLCHALDRLRAAVPGDGRLALCQGDINVFNYLFRSRQVVGVVDWEQARIGDPRSDAGQLVALSHLKGLPFGPPSSAPFVQAYEVASGERLAGLEYFRASWLFRLGVIYRGWMAFNDSEPWYSWAALSGLLEKALEELG
jgi:aminoglycoside phosphotransferase (APT) family kinase protein